MLSRLRADGREPGGHPTRLAPATIRTGAFSWQAGSFLGSFDRMGDLLRCPSWQYQHFSGAGDTVVYPCDACIDHGPGACVRSR